MFCLYTFNMEHQGSVQKLDLSAAFGSFGVSDDGDGKKKKKEKERKERRKRKKRCRVGEKSVVYRSQLLGPWRQQPLILLLYSCNPTAPTGTGTTKC
jgi:hypothetical protein